MERTKRWAIWVCALAVGAVTATTGMIGFVGLIASHWVRMVAGPDHRIVLPGSALLGAALVLAADAVARTVVKPARSRYTGRADGLYRRADVSVHVAALQGACMSVAPGRPQQARSRLAGQAAGRRMRR